jgi:hypothetical protein
MNQNIVLLVEDNDDDVFLNGSRQCRVAAGKIGHFPPPFLLGG